MADNPIPLWNQGMTEIHFGPMGLASGQDICFAVQMPPDVAWKPKWLAIDDGVVYVMSIYVGHQPQLFMSPIPGEVFRFSPGSKVPTIDFDLVRPTTVLKLTVRAREATTFEATFGGTPFRQN